MRHTLLLIAAALASLSLSAAEPAKPSAASKVVGKVVDTITPNDATMRTVLKPVAVATQGLIKTSQYLMDRIEDDTLGVRTAFDTVLPAKLGLRRLVLDVEPKIGDFFRRDFVRVPFELRYGLPLSIESYGGLTPIFPNPFRHGPESAWGPGMAKLGVRRDFRSEKAFFKSVVVGFESYAPLGEPPVLLVDHYLHLRPYVTVSRDINGLIPHTSLLVSLVHDRAVTCPGRDDVPSDQIKTNMTELAPGLLYKPAELGYFVQYGVRYYEDTLPKGHRTGHVAKAGLLWDMPAERSAKWGLAGRWQIELGLRHTDIPLESNSVGAYLRARWKIDLRKRD